MAGRRGLAVPMGIRFAPPNALINENRCNIVGLSGGDREAGYPLPIVCPRLNTFSSSSVAGRVNIRYADEFEFATTTYEVASLRFGGLHKGVS
jgi:hypothetical protein